MRDDRRREGGSASTRRAGSDRRGAILASARRLFATAGADGTTIRAVAAEAGVDPMLVLHYFGSKDGLFAASIKWPLDFNEIDSIVFGPGIGGLGDRLLRFFLLEWETEETRVPLMIMYRRGLSRAEHGRLLAEFAEDQLMGRLARAIGGPSAGMRSSLVLGALAGLAIARYILRVEPLASASVEEVVASVGPTIDRYISGEIGLPSTAPAP
jgi:AcrR family transcriptional regulator